MSNGKISRTFFQIMLSVSTLLSSNQLQYKSKNVFRMSAFQLSLVSLTSRILREAASKG